MDVARSTRYAQVPPRPRNPRKPPRALPRAARPLGTSANFRSFAGLCIGVALLLFLFFGARAGGRFWTHSAAGCQDIGWICRAFHFVGGVYRPFWGGVTLDFGGVSLFLAVLPHHLSLGDPQNAWSFVDVPLKPHKRVPSN